MTAQTAAPLLAGVAFVLYRAIRRSPTVGEKFGAVLGLAVGVIPAAWVMVARNVAPKLVVGYAVLFFAGSVLLKWAVYRGILSKHLHPRVGPATGGVAQGILSATCELGAALIAFGLVLTDLSVWEVFGFGAGAAAVEALMMTLLENPHAGGPEGKHVAAELARMREGPPWLSALIPFADRCIATVDHIACRGLVAAGLLSGRAWPIAVAFAAFAATDGFAHYCMRSSWEFGRPAVALRLYGLASIPAIVSVATWVALF